jgi:EAL domain-containing protein (putative c-di-GMP-specific phosphodiesterase class I)/GGDEF domain-containing protein
MLVSEQEERGRKFKLALRAGLPVLVLIGLVIYGTFFQNENIHFGLKEALLTAGLVFVTTYFIFFLLEEDSQKTLLDRTTNSYNFDAFLGHYKSHMPKSLVMICIDNLNIINENYGTKDVDNMLRSLVYQLDATMAAYRIDNAIIGRKYGGEFLIGSNSDKETILHAVSSFVEDHPSIQNIELDYRFGVISEPKGNLEKIILQLRDTVISPASSRISKKPDTQDTHFQEDAGDLEHLIISAINGSKILFHFRPLLNTRTSTIDAYEVSAKLKLEDGRDILPRIYLPVVNRLGMGRQYDFAVFRHALELLPLIDKKVSLSFNLSPFSLRDQDFRQKVFALLDDSGIDPHRLVVELYERKTHHNLEGYLKTLESFRTKGLRICIDNFGSSDASMEYMRRFKFDIVQFDRDYVNSLDDPQSVAMLKSLIDMSRTMHVATVAKWVDKEEQKKKLMSMGIDYLQGYGISKPISEAELINKYN